MGGWQEKAVTTFLFSFDAMMMMMIDRLVMISNNFVVYINF